MENMLDAYPTGLVACVSDGFDIFEACSEYWGDTLEKVLNHEELWSFAPMGDPVEVVVKCLEILDKFGYEETAQGYKYSPHSCD